MAWDFYFILTVQILIWFVVLGFPLYLLVGALAGATVRGIIGGLMTTLNQIEKGVKDAKDRKIL